MTNQIDPKQIRYAFIRHRGDPKHATRDDGVEVYRSDKFWIPEDREWIVAAPYDNHFIYEDKRAYHWCYMCTCGSTAVIVGSDVYKHDASPTASGKMMICMWHGQYGRHFDGSS